MSYVAGFDNSGTPDRRRCDAQCHRARLTKERYQPLGAGDGIPTALADCYSAQKGCIVPNTADSAARAVFLPVESN
jgi:hypothetical protein